MVMSYIFTIFLTVSLTFALLGGKGAALSAAVTEGAGKGITLALSMAGSLCLWSGASKLMERLGLTEGLGRLLSPVLHRLFPESKKDPLLRGYLSANLCANLLGLGNAATPLGIQSAKGLQDPARPSLATDSLCRLIVLNTASSQLIPANVAAVRASLGCETPFDILLPVWVTSLCSASLGVLAAWGLGKVWPHD